jgi:uncharacterized protein YndB with AHSA1/START domain
MKIDHKKSIDLQVSRTINATPEAVFDVWLDATSPGGPWFGAARVIVNPVVDGLFYSAIEHEGRTYPHYGRFVRLERGRLIEHTWVSEGTRGWETVVSISLEPRGTKTELTLRHTGVPDDDEGRKHEEGWSWVVSQMAEKFAS